MIKNQACTLSNETFNDSHQAQLDSCNQTKWQFILDSRVRLKNMEANTQFIFESHINTIYDALIVCKELGHDETALSFVSMDISLQKCFRVNISLQKCHKLQSKSTNATEICECWDQAAEDVEVN